MRQLTYDEYLQSTQDLLRSGDAHGHGYPVGSQQPIGLPTPGMETSGGVVAQRPVRYTAYPFTLDIGKRQQILPVNANRRALIIYITSSPTGSDRVFVALQEGPASVSDFDPNDIARSIEILSFHNPSEVLSVAEYQIFTGANVPSNAITLFTTTYATSGIVLEGQ